MMRKTDSQRSPRLRSALRPGRTRPPVPRRMSRLHFSFEGPFGTYDQMQLQRGLQVYTEVCSACHGLQYVPFRTSGHPGGPGLPGRPGARLRRELRGLGPDETKDGDRVTSARPRRPTTFPPSNEPRARPTCR